MDINNRQSGSAYAVGARDGKMTHETVKFMEGMLDTCPFCGKRVEIAILDAEGNPRDLDYLDEPWSGLSFSLSHRENKECVLYADPCDEQYVGNHIYDDLGELVEVWNNRKEGCRK